MSKVTAAKRVLEFPDNGFQAKNAKLWCDRCNKELDLKKHNITTHINSQAHKTMKGAVASTSSLTSYGAISQLEEQWEEMLTAFLSAGIPLHVFRNEKLRSWMRKYTKNGQHLPSESTLRRKLDKVSNIDIEQTIDLCAGKDICVTLDETVDRKNRKVLHILVKPLEFDAKSRLFVTKFLEKCNSEVIQQEVIQMITKLKCELKNLVVLVSDSVPYMMKAGKNLSVVCPRMTHTTCWSHILHLVSEEIRSTMPEADGLISGIKQALLKAPERRKEFFQFQKKNNMKKLLPPNPVLTRWATWLEAGSFHWDHITVIKDWVSNTKDKSAVMSKLKKLWTDSSDVMAEQLERIDKICPGLCASIKNIEGNKMNATEVWPILELVKNYLDCLGVPSEKLPLYLLEKHPALRFWQEVQILDPRKCPDNIDEGIPESLKKFSIQPVPLSELLMYKNLSSYEVKNKGCVDTVEFWKKYTKEMPTFSLLASKALVVPGSSADVERSFSYLKNILSALRMRFLEENLGSHLRLAFNDDAIDIPGGYEVDDQS